MTPDALQYSGRGKAIESGNNIKFRFAGETRAYKIKPCIGNRGCSDITMHGLLKYLVVDERNCEFLNKHVGTQKYFGAQYKDVSLTLVGSLARYGGYKLYWMREIF